MPQLEKVVMTANAARAWRTWGVFMVYKTKSFADFKMVPLPKCLLDIRQSFEEILWVSEFTFLQMARSVL